MTGKILSSKSERVAVIVARGHPSTLIAALRTANLIPSPAQRSYLQLDTSITHLKIVDSTTSSTGVRDATLPTTQSTMRNRDI